MSAIARLVQITLIGNVATLEIQRITPANAGDYVVTLRNPAGVINCSAKLILQSR
jgi:hypothetical protein